MLCRIKHGQTDKGKIYKIRNISAGHLVPGAPVPLLIPLPRPVLALAPLPAPLPPWLPRAGTWDSPWSPWMPVVGTTLTIGAWCHSFLLFKITISVFDEVILTASLVCLCRQLLKYFKVFMVRLCLMPLCYPDSFIGLSL